MYLARLLLSTSVNTKTYIFQNPNDPTILSEWRKWPLWRNSLTFSPTSTAKRRGTLEQKRLLLRCFMITLQDIHMYLYLLKMQVSKLYECLSRSAVDKFVQLCVVCHSSKPDNQSSPQRTSQKLFFVRARGHLTLASTVRSCR